MIIQTITPKSLPIETFNRFHADFNAAGNGQYNFTAENANVNQIAIADLKPQCIYLIDSISFSASIDEGVYLRSVVDNAFPRFRLRFRNNSWPLYPRTIPGINYRDGNNFNFWFTTPQRNQQLYITMEGILDQVAETVGVDTLYAQFSMVIYQEENLDKITKWREGTGKNIGEFYKQGLI